jgi:hypothetical protein
MQKASAAGIPLGPSGEPVPKASLRENQDKLMNNS